MKWFDFKLLLEHLIVFLGKTLKPGSHIQLTYLGRSRRLQMTTFGDLFQWVPGAPAMDRRHTQIVT